MASHTESVEEKLCLMFLLGKNKTFITRMQIHEQIKFPISIAAKNLKVSETTLKVICRQYNIRRWPQRKYTADVKQNFKKLVKALNIIT